MGKTVLAISGSTRKSSTNQRIIQLLIAQAPEINWIIDEGIDRLPHFNPDLDTEPAPEVVAVFRKQLAEADAVLICTPEYAMGVPGSLKNALDWTVSSASFSKKPVGVITASSLGEKGHASLLGTLSIIEAKLDEKAQLLIPHIKSRFNPDGTIKEDTMQLVNDFLKGFMSLLDSSGRTL